MSNKKQGQVLICITVKFDEKLRTGWVGGGERRTGGGGRWGGGGYYFVIALYQGQEIKKCIFYFL